MTTEKIRVKKEINLYVNEMFRVAEMFNEQGLKLDAVLIKDTLCKFVGVRCISELNLHGSDMFTDGTIAVVKSQDDQKWYTAWYELKDSYVSNEFKNWKLVKETKEYK
jgi:hypothetical protein